MREAFGFEGTPIKFIVREKRKEDVMGDSYDIFNNCPNGNSIIFNRFG